MRGWEKCERGMCMRMRERKAEEDMDGNKCGCKTERMRNVYERWTVKEKKERGVKNKEV